MHTAYVSDLMLRPQAASRGVPGRVAAGVNILLAGMVLFGWLRPAHGQEVIPIVSWNILRYDPPDSSAYQAMFRIMQSQQPKVILLQEAADAVGRTAFLIDFPIRYPYCVLGRPAKETVRSQILSVYPVLAAGEIFAEDASSPGSNFERPTIWADLDVDADRVADLRVYSAHFRSGDGTPENATRVNMAFACDASVAALLSSQPNAAIFFAGDLNCQPGESPLNILTARLTRLTVLDPNNGSAVTRPVSGRVIDHMLHSAGLAGSVSGQRIINTATGVPPSPALPGDSEAASDHLTLRATLTITGSGGTYTPTIADVRINEVFVDHTGTDTVEFIELAGPAGLSLTGLTVVVIEGDAAEMGQIDRVWSLAGQAIGSSGLFVLGTTATPNVNYSIGSTNRIENGTCTVLLINEFTSSLNADVDTDNNTLADFSIGAIVDAVGLNDGDATTDAIYYGAPVLGPVFRAGFEQVPAGVARKTTGLDTDSDADFCYTSFEVVPPAMGTGSSYDFFIASGPGIPNAYGCPPPRDANATPVAVNVYETILRDSQPGEIIILQGSDADGDPISYRILSLPGGGTLTDPLNGDAPVSVGTLLAGNQVRYTPQAGVTGNFSFLFRVADAYTWSQPATVSITLVPPPSDDVVISEIMYDPSGPEPGWEWVEITNLGTDSVALKTLHGSANNTPGNLTGITIPPRSTIVLTPVKTIGPTLAEFLSSWHPLAAGTVYQVSPWPGLANSGTETLTLIDAGDTVRDVVAYQAGTGGWPAPDNAASIYLTRNHVTSALNDDGTHWALSSVGVESAYASTGGDIGSPGIAPVTFAPICPVASDSSLEVNQGASPGPIITLTATDPDTPPASLTYQVLTLPAFGTLTDPGNGDAPVPAGGTLAGNQVRYTPPTHTSGSWQFTWRAYDGSCGYSNTATVSIQVNPVAPTTSVVITEIMYDPAGTEPDWEWVELTNFGSSAVSLGTLNDSNNNTNGNLAGLILGPGQTVVVTRTKGSNPSLATFLSAWTSLTAGQVFQTSSWPQLNNTGGDTLTVKDIHGVVLDVVAYQVNAGGWPNRNNSSSLYLRPGFYNTTDNDLPGSWALSVAGTHGAYATSGGDVGSPGLVFGHPPVPAPRLTLAESRRTHGSAGTFAVNLRATSRVEHRSPTTLNLYLEFDQPVQLTLGNASLTASSGTVSNVVASGNVVTAQLAAPAPGPVQMAMPGVAHAADAGRICPDAFCFVRLIADVNADRTVNSLDLVTVRNNLSLTVSAGNFRADVNADGILNTLDLVTVRNALSTGAGSCP